MGDELQISFRDIADRWIGEEIPATDAQITALVEDAKHLIRDELPHIYTSGDDAVKSRVRRVAIRLVLRVLKNPSGYRQVSRTTGPFTEQMMFGGDSPGEMTLTEQDRRDLVGPARGRRAFTIYPKGL